MGTERARMSDGEKEKLAEAASQNESQIQRAKSAIGGAHWILSDLLLSNKDRKFWAVQHHSWGSFLASPEIDIEETLARRMIRLRIVRTSIEAQGYTDIQWEGISFTRLTRDWLPCVKMDDRNRVVLNAKDAVELLEAARTLSAGDFQEAVLQKQVERQRDAVDTRYKKDMIVFAAGEDRPVGYVNTSRANKNAEYVTLRIERADITLPIKLEIRG